MTNIEKFDERHKTENLPTPANDSPAALMQMAMSKGLDLDKLEKMLELQVKWEERESKKAYFLAMADFRQQPLEILKDRKVSFQTSKGKTEYDHASLANVVNVIGAELGSHGLSAAWKTDQGNSGIKVTCVLSHRNGHSEEVSLTAPPDLSGSKNPIQAIASTVSYLERYTLLAITGLSTKDMDNDANPIEPEAKINDQQLADITTLQKDAKLSDKEFVKRLKNKFKVEKAEDLTETQAEELIKALDAIKNA